MLSHGYEPNKTSIRLFSLVMEPAENERLSLESRMGKPASVAVSFFFLCVSLLCVRSAVVSAITAETDDGTERWGYVEVRPKAHLFWWYYKCPQRQRASNSPEKPWPTVLWLQGGPGVSGIGAGNFVEIGPLDADMKPRNSTWLQKADLIFVDNPVGVGYSYVEDDGLLVTTDWQAAADMMTVLKALVQEVPTLQSSPLFLVAESYGGKYAATLGVSVARAISADEINLTLGGVVLGDSWISPEDFTLSYGRLLQDISRLDSAGANEANRRAEAVKELIAAGKWAAAHAAFNDLYIWLDNSSSHVYLYNFLLDTSTDSTAAAPSAAAKPSATTGVQLTRYSEHLSTSGSNKTVEGILNGVVKERLKIIPKDLKWRAVNYAVHLALVNDFMKPRIDEIDELLSLGVNVTVYNGQLDVMCSVIGAEAWVEKLKWDGLRSFLSLPRLPLYCGPSKATKAFVRSYKNLHFYWILGAGHLVPVDQPCIALSMIGSITQSPAS